jgi:hypothetical protein
LATSHSSAAGAAASAEEVASVLLLHGKAPERQRQQQVSQALQLFAGCLLLQLCFSCWVWWVLLLQLVLMAA